MVYFNYVAHRSFDSWVQMGQLCRWRWRSTPFVEDHFISTQIAHHPLEKRVYITYHAVDLFALYGHIMSRFVVVMLTDVTRWTHAGQGCFFKKNVLLLFLPSLSKWQVREGLHWGLPLQQQWHLQPHRWLLPMRSRLDWRGLLSGYALTP